MAFVRCKTCGGEFDERLADGMTYFHACPPLSLREKQAALVALSLVLSPRETKRVQDARAADLAIGVKPGELSRVDGVLDTIVVPRPNQRDENIQKPAKRGDPVTAKADGLGVEPAP